MRAMVVPHMFMSGDVSSIRPMISQRYDRRDQMLVYDLVLLAFIAYSEDASKLPLLEMEMVNGLRSNPFIPHMLLDDHSAKFPGLEDRGISSSTPRSNAASYAYCYKGRAAWRSVPGAIEWLSAEMACGSPDESTLLTLLSSERLVLELEFSTIMVTRNKGQMIGTGRPEFYYPAEYSALHQEGDGIDVFELSENWDNNGWRRILHRDVEKVLFWPLLSRHCGSKICNTCHVLVEKLYKCSKCKAVSYCDVSCQTEAWEEHKPVCRRAKEMALAAASAMENRPTNEVTLGRVFDMPLMSAYLRFLFGEDSPVYLHRVRTLVNMALVCTHWRTNMQLCCAWTDFRCATDVTASDTFHHRIRNNPSGTWNPFKHPYRAAGIINAFIYLGSSGIVSLNLTLFKVQDSCLDLIAKTCKRLRIVEIGIPHDAGSNFDSFSYDIPPLGTYGSSSTLNYFSSQGLENFFSKIAPLSHLAIGCSQDAEEAYADIMTPEVYNAIGMHHITLKALRLGHPPDVSDIALCTRLCHDLEHLDVRFSSSSIQYFDRLFPIARFPHLLFLKMNFSDNIPEENPLVVAITSVPTLCYLYLSCFLCDGPLTDEGILRITTSCRNLIALDVEGHFRITLNGMRKAISPLNQLLFLRTSLERGNTYADVCNDIKRLKFVRPSLVYLAFGFIYGDEGPRYESDLAVKLQDVYLTYPTLLLYDSSGLLQPVSGLLSEYAEERRASLVAMVESAGHDFGDPHLRYAFGRVEPFLPALRAALASYQT